MRYILSNGLISVSVDSLGAELRSLKKSDKEYLWGADPEYWDRTSPILFPVPGNLKNGSFSTGSKTYHMPQHGFARDMEFTPVEVTDSSLTLQLASSDKTLSIWPFRFVLEAAYTLSGSSLYIHWTVHNCGDSDMYFSIGGHPGFLCPDGHYYVAYVSDGTSGSSLVPASSEPISMVTDDGLLSHTTRRIRFDNGRLPITRELFRQGNGTLVFTDTSIRRIALADSDLNEYVTVDLSTPVLALWSPDLPDTPFVCIEPWCGVCDYEDADGIWEHRAFSNKLDPGQIFRHTYSITV